MLPLEVQASLELLLLLWSNLTVLELLDGLHVELKVLADLSGHLPICV